MRAYLAADAGERRVEAFALFNVFYQAGILAGPLVGLAFMAVDFRLTAACAAAVFAVLTIAQLFALPQHDSEPTRDKTSVLQDWRTVVSNRSFLLFAVAMIGSLRVDLPGLPGDATARSGPCVPALISPLIAAMFAVSGVVAVSAQLRITRWFSHRWGTSRCLVIGMTVVVLSFVPLILLPDNRFGAVAAIGALLLSTALLAIGSAAVFPFEMDTVVVLSGGRLVGTHYGFYSTIVGVGILAATSPSGLWFRPRRSTAPGPWCGALTGIGLCCAAAPRPGLATATYSTTPIARRSTQHGDHRTSFARNQRKTPATWDNTDGGTHVSHPYGAWSEHSPSARWWPMMTSPAAAAHVDAKLDGAGPGGFGVVTQSAHRDRQAGHHQNRGAHPRGDPVAHRADNRWRAGTLRSQAHDRPALYKDDGTPVTEVVNTVTWTSTGGGIPRASSRSSPLYAGPLPDADTLALPTTQTFSDGSTEAWTEATTGGDKPKFPVPAASITKPAGSVLIGNLGRRWGCR